MLLPAHRRRTRRPLQAAALAACAALLGACTLGPSPTPTLAVSGAGAPRATSSATTTQTTMPLGPGGPGQQVGPARWHDCPVSLSTIATDGTEFLVSCATVTVPLSYRDPRGPRIQLQLAEARTGATPKDAPILVVAQGDPGASSYRDIADLAAELPAVLRDQYVVVAADLRGTGESVGVYCLSDSTVASILGMAADPSTPAGSTQLAAISRQLTFDCGDATGPALTTLNSTNAADDLDSIRSALGASSLAILASGGSATIGTLYVHRYPGRVRAAVLDSPGDPLTTWQSRAALSAAAAEQLLDDFAAACPQFTLADNPGAEPGCPLGDNARSAVTALTTRYATSGVRSGQLVMTGGSVLLALLTLLPDADSWPALAGALAELADGDAEALARLLHEAYIPDDIYAALSADIIFTCNDTAARPSIAEIADAAAAARHAAPLFGAYTVGLSGLCSSWPVPDDTPARLSGAGAPPVIVIGSVQNPLHPFGEAQSVAAQLASAVLLSWQSGTDGAYPANACIGSVVNDYLAHGTVPERGVLCPP